MFDILKLCGLNAHLRGRVVVVCLVIAIGPSALAQSDVEIKLAEQLRVELKNQFGTVQQLNTAITKTYGIKLSAEKEEIARNALRALMFNEAVPLYIAKLLVPVYRPDLTSKEIASATVEGIAQMQVKGLARLPAERQAAFVSYMFSMMKSIPPSDCKALLEGRLDTNASAALERRYIASLPPDRFEAVTNLYKEASEAELAGYPDPRFINSNQAKLAEKVYETASTKRLRDRVSAPVLQRVAQGGDVASASEVCLVMSENFAGMLDMAEPYRSWQLTRFLQSMQ